MPVKPTLIAAALVASVASAWGQVPDIHWLARSHAIGFAAGMDRRCGRLTEQQLADVFLGVLMFASQATGHDDKRQDALNAQFKAGQDEAEAKPGDACLSRLEFSVPQLLAIGQLQMNPFDAR